MLCLRRALGKGHTGSRGVRGSYPYWPLWLAYFALGLNAWAASMAFHARDVRRTEARSYRFATICSAVSASMDARTVLARWGHHELAQWEHRLADQEECVPQAYDYLSAAAFVLVGLLLALARTSGLTRPRQWALLAAPAAVAYGYVQAPAVMTFTMQPR